MQKEPRAVVCLLTGDGLPDTYADRLYAMLDRHFPGPFRLHCFTDRPRPLRPEIQQHSIETWSLIGTGYRPTIRKLRLFHPDSNPFEECLYLDLTLVIRKSMADLLEFVDQSPEPLVIVDDWNHDTVNSCVMRIRRDSPLQQVFTDYEEGRQYPHKVNGDQDFLDASIKAHGLSHLVATFPPETIASYRGLRRLDRKSPAKAQQLLQAATIVKFHGSPRPHEVYRWKYWLREAMRSPTHVWHDYFFMRRELSEWWGPKL